MRLKFTASGALICAKLAKNLLRATLI